ncbi:MAG TPA: SDR family NAD(P)-dependent oxidoreductase [Steroidobacteraceae bacterium]|nr:SDR family NAD(P)-dependent oxidoreductase [Steroidobacteraceae bacterium]
MSLASLSRRLPGKRAFITGGGSGLGLEFARALAAEGWAVGLFDLDPARLVKAEEELSNNGARVYAFPGDVRLPDELTVAVNSFADIVGGLDLMINNAGVACAGSIIETSLEDWRWIVDINVLGVVNGCRAGVPQLQRSGRGILLNVSSAAAFVSAPFMAPYNATKAAVLSIAESLAAELSSAGIQVSVAMPGFMNTALLETARGPDRERAIAEDLMRNSRYTAAAGARDILLGAARGDLYIVLPKAMRNVWRFKRWLPDIFVRQFPHLRERFMSKARGE